MREFLQEYWPAVVIAVTVGVCFYTLFDTTANDLFQQRCTTLLLKQEAYQRHGVQQTPRQRANLEVDIHRWCNDS